MEQCSDCVHYGLYMLVKDGKPFQYYGDVPCVNCCNLRRKTSKFTPVSRYTNKRTWANPEYRHK